MKTIKLEQESSKSVEILQGVLNILKNDKDFFLKILLFHRWLFFESKELSTILINKQLILKILPLLN